MSFKPSQSAEKFIEDVHHRVGARNKAVLGRSAISLALAEGVPQNYKAPAQLGKDLSWDALMGGMEETFRAAVRLRAGEKLDNTSFEREIRRAFEYGCDRLAKLWETCGRDQSKFVAELLKLTEKAYTGPAMPGTTGATLSVVEKEVRLQLLTEGNPWVLNQAGGNSLLVISGQPGRGKSQLALDLLAQVSRQGLRFLLFDLKGELEPAGPGEEQKAATREKFLHQTGAQYIRLIDQALPVNPLYAGNTGPETANIATRIASLVRAFGPQMGQNQEDGIRGAYQQLTAPDFPSLVNQMEQDGVDGVALSVMQKIVDFNIFATAHNARPFEDWMSRSSIIDFKRIQDNDTRVLAVAFILNFFIERLNRNLAVKNNIQPLQMVLFVDEAHNILPKDNKAKLLEKLAREGRSWGFPLWLASQDADQFASDTVDFAKLATAGIHFSPETLSPREQKQVLGGSISRALEKGEAALRLAGNLATGNARQYWRDNGL